MKAQANSPSLVRQETALLRALAGLRREISTRTASERLAGVGRDRQHWTATEPSGPVAGSDSGLRPQPLVEDAAD